MRYRPVITVALLTFSAAALPTARVVAQGCTPGQDVADADEIAVMGTVLEAAYAHAAQGWVGVGARTATFECNPSANIGIDVGGCSGMRVSTETPEQRLRAVRNAMPEVPAELAADLLEKSQCSALLSRLLPAHVQQDLWAPEDIAAEFKAQGNPTFKAQGNPTFAAYFSRPGFDGRRTKALIYLATMNWTDRSKSMGQYLYLEKEDENWVVKGHAQVWGL